MHQPMRTVFSHIARNAGLIAASRVWLGILLGLLLASNTALAATPITIGLSAVVMGEKQTTIAHWQDYLSARLQRPVSFLQRRDYHEFVNMLDSGQIAAGWIDGSQYLLHPASLRLLAVGVWRGKPTYRSYLIVPDNDTSTRSIADLRGKIFGYSDNHSSSGYHVPVAEILRLHAEPRSFFSRTLYTHSHTKLIKAVADGLVNGARVDSYIYEQMRHYYPAIVARTRLVQQSDDYGFPPIVTRADLPAADFDALQTVLLNMHNDKTGRTLLGELGLDKFIAGNRHLYDSTAALLNEIEHAEKD